MNEPFVVIVPYRNREHHLRMFVPHLEVFLKHRDFVIVVVEQCDEFAFNKGQLLNVGYSRAKEIARVMCFHDVDMLPMDQSCDYSSPESIAHLAGRAEQFGYKMPYPQYLGGVFMSSSDDYARLNGYSNCYWGWGGEDDDFFIRCYCGGASIEHRPGRYRCLPHNRTLPSFDNAQNFRRSLMTYAKFAETFARERVQDRASVPDVENDRTSCTDFATDGLSTLQYEIVSSGPLSARTAFDPPVSDRHELIRVALRRLAGTSCAQQQAPLGARESDQSTEVP